MAASPIPGAFGAVDKTKTQHTKKHIEKPAGKYEEIFGAIKNAAVANETVDQQTGLEWDNIEGEVMGVVLTAAILSGSMFTKVNHPVFNFASVEDTTNKAFSNKFVECLKSKTYLLPFTPLKQTLNELMISYKRQGRMEMVEMVKALQLSLQESEKSDGMLGALRK